MVVACTSVEKNTEKHTTHFIDAGDPISNGVKVSDPSEVSIVIYKDGKPIGQESRSLSGLMVLTPNRYRSLLIIEHASVAFLKAHGADTPTDHNLRAEFDEMLQAASTKIER